MHLPVTEKSAGSNPVVIAPKIKENNMSKFGSFLLFVFAVGTVNKTIRYAEMHQAIKSGNWQGYDKRATERDKRAEDRANRIAAALKKN